MGSGSKVQLWHTHTHNFLFIFNDVLTTVIILCSPKGNSSQNLKKRMLSWNPIVTKDSCSSGGSSYRRTRKGNPPPPSFPPGSLVLRNLSKAGPTPWEQTTDKKPHPPEPCGMIFGIARLQFFDNSIVTRSEGRGNQTLFFFGNLQCH